ncbi:MAG TPA: protein-glutamate O-methyltransferase CheR [Gemmatimonadaceae bacterium]|nr:protein-glutamate O-methyltransferase CheR [Gemmatimonadaceae bacterium]
MTDGALDDGFAMLSDKITRERGFGCASYKEKCVRRRIAVRMRARGVHTFEEYGQVLDRDAREYDLLLDALTINVTKFFRNPETFGAIDRELVPNLYARVEPQLRIWSAGCASGEEPYSLAMLMHRYAMANGKRFDRVEVLGTDLDRASLAAAEHATYLEPTLSDTPPEIRQMYFSMEAPYRIHSDVRARVQFRRHDLLREPFPEPQHMIVCRNVIIYFDRPSQEELFEKFAAALLPGGFLVLGRVETLFGPARTMFTPVDSRERLFRRV